MDNAALAPRSLALYGQPKRSPGLAPGQSESGMGPRSTCGRCLHDSGIGRRGKDFDDLDEGPFFPEPIRWLARHASALFQPLGYHRPGTKHYATAGGRWAKGTHVAEFVQPQVTVPPGTAADFSHPAGPKAQARLEALAPNLSLTVDYGFLWWIAVPLFQLLELLNHLVNNWGLPLSCSPHR